MKFNIQIDEKEKEVVIPTMELLKAYSTVIIIFNLTLIISLATISVLLTVFFS